MFVVAGMEGILPWFGATIVFCWDNFSILCVYFVTFMTYCAAFFACAGVVNSRCRSRISSAVSISSSSIVVISGAEVFRVCLVGWNSVLVYCLFGWASWLSCNSCKNFAHFVVPSMSSMFLTRFLVLST